MKTTNKWYYETKANPEKYKEYLQKKRDRIKKLKEKDPEYNKKWATYMKDYREKIKKKEKENENTQTTCD